MKIRYTLLIVTILISSLFHSCRKIKCEAFNLNHQSVDWHLFPDSYADYTFDSGDTLTINLEQTLYRLDDYEERTCHMCACFTEYSVAYSNSNKSIDIQCIASYNSLDGISPGSLFYMLNGFQFNLHLTDDGNTFHSEWITEEDNFEFVRTDSVFLNDKSFYDIAEISIFENQDIDKLWIAKGKGLVGFRLNDIVLTIKD